LVALLPLSHAQEDNGQAAREASVHSVEFRVMPTVMMMKWRYLQVAEVGTASAVPRAVVILDLWIRAAALVAPCGL
jgi:hypothetical protein